jgi:hypothetical protein
MRLPNDRQQTEISRFTFMTMLKEQGHAWIPCRHLVHRLVTSSYKVPVMDVVYSFFFTVKAFRLPTSRNSYFQAFSYSLLSLDLF